MNLTAENTEFLKPLCGKYIWWKTEDEALKIPERVIARVMNIGDYADVQKMSVQLGDAVLREVLTMPKQDSSTNVHGPTGMIARD